MRRYSLPSSETCGCLFAILIIVGLVSYVIYRITDVIIINSNCTKTQMVSNERELDIVSPLNCIKNFTIHDFTIERTSLFTIFTSDYYIVSNCTFNNITFDCNKIEKFIFINCKFINVKFNGNHIIDTIFDRCIFEDSEFNDNIFGKDVRYYDWTISTITLTGNTYTPEHIENGVNKFETFVEESKE